jgi:hypothetical protein
MGQPKRRFWVWVFVLSALWVAVNWNGRTLLIEWWAGFPWSFAFCIRNQLQWFDPAALAGDVALGAVVVLGLAALCVWRPRGRA